MSFCRTFLIKVASAGMVACGALFAMAPAGAQVNWSVGVNVPGVSVGVVEPGPVYYEPAPVYSRPAPPPVYYEPAPPVYYRQPAPVYVRPDPVYYGPPAQAYYEPGDRWRHRHYHRRDWDERGDRD